MTSRVSLLSSTAIAAAAIIFAGAPSSAASLDALEKRVKALEKAGAGKSVSRSKKTMSIKISGHINRMIQNVDNGTNSEIRFTTSNQSRSRVRWDARGKLTDDLSVQAFWELGNQSGISTAQTITGAGEGNGGSNGDNTALDTRHIDLRLTSKSMGKLYIGHSSEGSDGIPGTGDLSGTLVALSGGFDESLTLAEPYQLSTGGAVASGATTRNVGTTYDAGRRDRIRYDTPKFAGFQAVTSMANKDRFTLGLKYGGSFSGVKVKAGVGMVNVTATDIQDYVGSIGVLLPVGLSFQVSIGERDRNTAGRENPEGQFYRVGYRFKGSELGETRLAVSYSEQDDVRANGDQSEVIGVAVVQILEPLGSELYFSYLNFDLEQTGVTGIEDIDVVSVGLRVKF